MSDEAPWTWDAKPGQELFPGHILFSFRGDIGVNFIGMFYYNTP